MIAGGKRGVLGVGVIGTGSIGKVHIRGLLALPDTEIRWLCGRDVARVRQVADQFNLAGVPCFGDCREALAATPAADAVVVATPQMVHLEHGLAVMEKGLPCFMEKPLTPSLADSRRLCDAARARGIRGMAGFRLRFFDTVRQVQRTLSGVQTVAVRMFDNPWVGGFWKYAPELGGGNVMDQFCHCADLVRFLAGSNPVAVTAQTAALCGSGCPVDHIAASFRLESGALANVTMGDSGISNLLGKFSIELTSAQGAASLYARFAQAELNLGEARYRLEAVEEKAAIEQMRAFTQCVRGEDVPGLPGLEDGFWADWMLDRALAAARSGREMPFDKELQP
jgi:predicted dehydrogenase